MAMIRGNNTSAKENTVFGEAYAARKSRSEPSVGSGQQNQRRVRGIDKMIVRGGDHDHQRRPEEQLRCRVKQFSAPLWRLKYRRAKTLHILPHRLQLVFRPHGEFSFRAPVQ